MGKNGEDSTKYSIQGGYSGIDTNTRQLTGANKLKYKPGGTTSRAVPIKDEQCKICDMSGNVYEWSTETCTYSANHCDTRGSYYGYGFDKTSRRKNIGTDFGSSSDYEVGCRPILYLEY